MALIIAQRIADKLESNQGQWHVDAASCLISGHTSTDSDGTRYVLNAIVNNTFLPNNPD